MDLPYYADIPTCDETEARFIELGPEDICNVDEETARTLELVRNNDDIFNRKHTLFGYLDLYTSTTSGSRLLKDNILRPLCHQVTLEHRLECVEFLTNHPDVLSCISNCLRNYGTSIDLDNFIPSLHNVHKKRAYTISVAEKRLDIITTVELIVSHVPSLLSALDDLPQQTLILYRNALLDPSYNEILDEIYNVIEPEVTTNKAKRSRMFRIKSGVDALFDVARCTYLAAVDDLEQYVKELQREDNLPWKLGYSETKGYFLSLTCVPRNLKLNPRYIRVVRTRTQLTCTTTDLMRTNVRATISYENSMKLTNEILLKLITSIVTHVESLHRLVSVVGMLDLVVCFAKHATQSRGRLVKPKFNTSETVIIGSRHPVLETVLSISDMPVVPNDVFFSAGTRNLMLVTGPNMGGKSIFLKQVGLIQIMAQIGCFIPAMSGDMKLMNRIVARSGIGADHESSCSSFMWEMRGIATALRDDDLATSPSVLYVIDEVGRGTTIDDGTSYGFAIAEELANRRNCFTVFATHFEQVFQLSNLYNNIHSYHFEYEEKIDPENGRPKLKISHCLVPGIADRCHYGLKLAEAFRLPEELLQTARKHLMLDNAPRRTSGRFDNV